MCINSYSQPRFKMYKSYFSWFSQNIERQLSLRFPDIILFLYKSVTVENLRKYVSSTWDFEFSLTSGWYIHNCKNWNLIRLEFRWMQKKKYDQLFDRRWSLENVFVSNISYTSNIIKPKISQLHFICWTRTVYVR